jgi:hypothetical protein
MLLALVAGVATTLATLANLWLQTRALDDNAAWILATVFLAAIAASLVVFALAPLATRRLGPMAAVPSLAFVGLACALVVAIGVMIVPHGLGSWAIYTPMWRFRPLGMVRSTVQLSIALTGLFLPPLVGPTPLAVAALVACLAVRRAATANTVPSHPPETAR